MGILRKEGAINAAEVHFRSEWNAKYDKYTGYHVYQIEDGTWNVVFNYDSVKTIGPDKELIPEEEVEEIFAEYGYLATLPVEEGGAQNISVYDENKAPASNRTPTSTSNKANNKPRGKIANKPRGKTSGKVLPNTGDYSFFNLAAFSLLAGLGLVNNRRKNN